MKEDIIKIIIFKTLLKMLSLRGKVDYVLVLIVKNYNEVTFDFTPFFKRKK